MWPFLTQVKLEDFTQDYLELTQKNLKGLDNLKRVKEEDIQCGVSEKEAVYREDKIILYHFKPVVEKPFEIPLLMVYALVNRPYMVDLHQEQRNYLHDYFEQNIFPVLTPLAVDPSHPFPYILTHFKAFGRIFIEKNLNKRRKKLLLLLN